MTPHEFAVRSFGMTAAVRAIIEKYELPKEEELLHAAQTYADFCAKGEKMTEEEMDEEVGNFG